MVSAGVALWKTDIGVPIYSPLALCHAPMMRFPRSHDSADYEQECVILFGTQDGGLFQLGVYGTHQARKVGRSENGISSGAGDTILALEISFLHTQCLCAMHHWTSIEYQFSNRLALQGPAGGMRTYFKEQKQFRQAP